MFGVGTGWYGPEYEARGCRTAEMLAAVRRLRTEDSATFEGQFYRFRDVPIEPRPAAMPPVCVSGGARVSNPDSPNMWAMEAMALRVLYLIVQGDSWLSRSAADLELIKRDWGTVSAEVVRRPSTLCGSRDLRHDPLAAAQSFGVHAIPPSPDAPLRDDHRKPRNRADHPALTVCGWWPKLLQVTTRRQAIPTGWAGPGLAGSPRLRRGHFGMFVDHSQSVIEGSPR